jgi:hypothetical protein
MYIGDVQDWIFDSSLLVIVPHPVIRLAVSDLINPHKTCYTWRKDGNEMLMLSNDGDFVNKWKTQKMTSKIRFERTTPWSIVHQNFMSKFRGGMNDIYCYVIRLPYACYIGKTKNISKEFLVRPMQVMIQRSLLYLLRVYVGGGGEPPLAWQIKDTPNLQVNVLLIMRCIIRAQTYH